MELKDLATPFDKRYCAYFYYLMWIFIIIFALSLGMLVYGLIAYSGKDKMHLSLNIVSMMINLLLAYFTNRLFYSMCVNSLK